MPPKTRGSKVSKASKENIAISSKSKTKSTIKVVKLPRKALADKTNSASDDNASFVQSKLSEKIVRNEQGTLLTKHWPRRDRRVPNRYVENNGLLNLSNRRNGTVEIQEPSKLTPIKSVPKVELSPLKTPKLSLDSSLATRRPKRISRLPSKFDDHSVSPSKFVPVQPSYASTPKILSNTTKQVEKKNSNKNVSPKPAVASENVIKANKKRTVKKKTSDTNKSQSPNSSADTNNNAKKDHLPRNKTKYLQNISPKVSVPYYAKATPTKRNNKVTDKNFSFRILEDKKKSLKRDASYLDVYEFTYDPNEEPPPQKKKRKKPAKKREPKPKTFVFKNNYDKNLAKALTALKNTVSAKSAKPIVKVDNAKLLATQTCMTHPTIETIVTTVKTQAIPSNPTSGNSDKSHVSMKNYNSIRVEDIALDFEQDHSLDDVNYSPVHSPCPLSTSTLQNDIPGPERSVTNNDLLHTSVLPISTSNRSAPNNDPLNLKDDLSFFDDQPVASSSMNVSVRNPQASPWRVEFGSLPIKWQVNTYVKPNMTPAFDSSFINFNENKKKHVYTNIVPDTNEENDIPQIYEDNASKLKQTSIISFIKEVIEKNAKKKKDKMTPIKANSLFEELNDTSLCKGASLKQKDFVTPKKNAQSKALSKNLVTPPSQHVSEISHEDDTDNSKEKENSKENVKNAGKEKRDEDVTYFGFDDTDHDQENLSPSKKMDKRRLRALKPRSRAVLQEINLQKGPTRAALPVAVKTKANQTANKLFDQIKSANEPPVFPDKEPIQSTETTNTTVVQNDEGSNDGQSVHLFEDMELVHHSKGHRKSYGKAKKGVTFRQNSISDSDVPPTNVAEHSTSSEEDNLHDLTFKIPTVEPKKTAKKKKSKKPKLSKKEEQEVEAWAAGFNSMCEDIEEFHLVVE